MLSVLKNALVTGASKEDGGIRKKELDWFSSNCWIVASQAAVIAGFTFSQLSKQPEPDVDGAGTWFHLFHAAFTGLGFVCALSVLVRATFSGIYAQGLALRGHAGFSDMAAAVRRLRADQDRILGQFMLSLACFLLSSFAAVFLVSRKGKASVKVEAALLFVSLAVAAVAWRAINLFSHGRVQASTLGPLKPAATAAAAAAACGVTAAVTHSRAFSTDASGNPLVGRQAPDFEADAHMPSGETGKVSLKELLQKHDGVCLVFYPMDFTFVCPTELRSFNAKKDEFQARNWMVLGMSVDSVHSHGAWCRLSPTEGGLGPLWYPLVSDLSKNITRSFGLLTGGTVALRGCVLIDKKGLVRHMTINDLSMSRSVDEVLRVIDMINHLAKNQKNVCPANWTKGKPGMEPSLQGLKDFVSRQEK
ncbi:hypothetical protein Esti_003112 [Eimeria stiedai]